MNQEKDFYTTGEFARKAAVTIRTIRYYDKQNLLKPSYVNSAGYRFYTEEDFAKLQRILVLKYLGFSLEEIRTMPMQNGMEDLEPSFQMQLRFIRQKKEHLERMEKAVMQVQDFLLETKRVDWDGILQIIHLSNMEKNIAEHYKTATNLDIRIELHRRYSINEKGWFPWLYEQLCFKGVKEILEIGCGNGEMWQYSRRSDLKGRKIILSDISSGMIQDAKAQLEKKFPDCFLYKVMDGQALELKSKSMDFVIANHVLFYMKDLKKALEEVNRVLKVNGTFYCSAYGKNHMKEITELVQEFDSRIRLSDVNLYEQFGLENGEQRLKQVFAVVEFRTYKDGLIVDKAEPLIDYVLSCHGNQRELLDGHTDEFKRFLMDKIKRHGSIQITKEAGVFICKKKK